MTSIRYEGKHENQIQLISRLNDVST